MGADRKQEITRLLKRGLNHYGLGDLEAAISSWEKALALDPRNRAAHDYLGTAYEESGEKRRVGGPIDDDDDTPRTFENSLEFDIDDDEADTLIGDALAAYKSGQLEEAWSALSEVAEREPDRLDVQGYLAMMRTERARAFAREVGDQGRVLTLKPTMQEIMELNLTPEEGFLLSQIDGSVTIEQLLNLASDRVRTLEIIAKFIREGLVE